MVDRRCGTCGKVTPHALDEVRNFACIACAARRKGEAEQAAAAEAARAAVASAEPQPPATGTLADLMCRQCRCITAHRKDAAGNWWCDPCRLRAASTIMPAPPAPDASQQFCARCGGMTWHDPRGCTRCRLIADDQAAAARAAKRSSRRRGGIIGSLFTFGLVTVVSGFFHCVYGGDQGFTVVEKEEWGFYDQFVDLDEIIGTPLITQVGRARTIRALIRAGVLERPKFGRDDDE